MEKKPASVLQADKKLKTFKLKKADDTLPDNIERAEWNWDEVNGTCIIRIPANVVNERIVIEN